MTYIRVLLVFRAASLSFMGSSAEVFHKGFMGCIRVLRRYVMVMWDGRGT